MSSWVAHVKSVQAKEGISYKAAMTKAKESYKKPEKSESKAHEAGEAKAPVKRKSKKEEKKEELPEIVMKSEKKEKLAGKYENEKRVSSAEKKGKKKPSMLMN